MSLSLDMIGKFVLVTIIISVVTGLMLQFEGDIEESMGNLLGNQNEVETSKTVKFSPNNQNQKVAGLVQECYQKYLKESVDSYVCFVVRSDGSDFNFQGDDVENALSEEAKEITDVEDVNSGTFVVRYDSIEGQIRVE